MSKKGKSKPLIPKIIHQIWLGPKEPPIQWMNTWKNMHPQWEYRLWTENTLFKLANQRQYDQIQSYAGKADILRLEILYLYGGIYIDADYECLTPLDEHLLHVPFFSCYENEVMRPGLIANSVIGSKPKHPLLSNMMQAISEIEDVNQEASWMIVGPLLFTKIIRFYEVFHGSVKILPSYAFNPIHFLGARYSGKEKVYATHHWVSTTTGQNYQDSLFYYET